MGEIVGIEVRIDNGSDWAEVLEHNDVVRRGHVDDVAEYLIERFFVVRYVDHVAGPRV